MTETGSSDKLVNYHTDAGVARIELCNPPANCYSQAMMRQLDEAILSARFDDDVHVIVLQGAGEKFFCAGADINDLNDVSPRYKYYFCLHANETLMRLEQTPKLTIAALNGHCVGGGLEVALACDFRVAKRDSGKLGLPEVHLGVLPGTGGTQRLARLIGKSRALEWMLEGNNVSFDDGLAAGIVTHVWDAAEFETRVTEYARGFCPPAKASKAVGLIKRSVQTGGELSLADGLALERELQQQLFQSGDAKEGLRAYVEKRSPQFRGD
ncbi:MAG: enoyl-CoA hydratase/isomerase family protein [Planctomycetota bacterium]